MSPHLLSNTIRRTETLDGGILPVHPAGRAISSMMYCYQDSFSLLEPLSRSTELVAELPQVLA